MLKVSRFRRQSAFTLVELLVVIAIIGVLVARFKPRGQSLLAGQVAPIISSKSASACKTIPTP